MFTFAATPIKFVGLFVLFAWCTVWCVYELTRPGDWRRRVSNALHLLMSVVMLAMVWTGVWMPLASVIGVPAIVAVFALATCWFLWRAVEARAAGRAALAQAAGHALMFAAMTWHLSAMAIKRGAMAGASSGAGMPSTPGMSPGSGGMAGMAGQAGGAAVTLAVIGVPFMVYLLGAGLNDVRRALLPRAAASVCHCGTDCACGPDCACGASVPASEEVREHEAELSGPAPAASRQLKLIVAAPAASGCHEARGVGTPAYRLSALSDAAMNLGMFWMSTGLLVAIAPFMRLFSF